MDHLSQRASSSAMLRGEQEEVCPVLLPEDQMEVLSLQESCVEVHGSTLPVKMRIPSWSLIANICDKVFRSGIFTRLFSE